MMVAIDDFLTENDPLIGPPIVINMDKDVDRWSDLNDHLSQWNIKPDRFSAISGISLPALPNSMTENPSTVNLNLSHAAISRNCCLNTQKMAWLILEDDCRFVGNPKHHIAKILEVCAVNKINWSIISLGCFSYDWQGVRQAFDYDGAACLSKTVIGWYPWGSHAYLVNRNFGLKISSKMQSCLSPPDHVLIEEINVGNGYLHRPSIAYQEEYESYRGGVALTKASADMHPNVIKSITNK